MKNLMILILPLLLIRKCFLLNYYYNVFYQKKSVLTDSILSELSLSLLLFELLAVAG